MQTMVKMSVMRVGLFLLFVGINVGFAADWPQWRGVNRDGKSLETGLLKQWPVAGPPRLGVVGELGEGWSSASIINDVVYVTGMKEREEYLTIIDKNGKIVVQKKYGQATRRSYPGARTTPTIDGERVYVISGAGQVVCLRADNADVVWLEDAFEKYDGKYGTWGIAESPLVDDKHVYYTVCGPETTMIALDKTNGDLVWKSKSLNDQSAYVSPIMVQRGGKEIVVGVTGDYIIGVNAANGEILWNYPYTEKHPAENPRRGTINAVSPLYRNGGIYVTSGYNHVGVNLGLADDGNEVALKWVDENLDVHHGGVVEVDGYIYGASWDGNNDGNWMCLDWQSGGLKWQHHWECKGSIIYADGMLYCFEEKDGNLALIEASSQGFRLAGSLQMTEGEGKYWAHPSISNGRLYLRHGDVMAVYDIQRK